MPRFFGREFSYLSESHLEDLRNLEEQGCVYTQLYREEHEKFGFCRIQFEPDEIVDYVDSITAYEEFLSYTESGYSPEEALKKRQR